MCEGCGSGSRRLGHACHWDNQVWPHWLVVLLHLQTLAHIVWVNHNTWVGTGWDKITLHITLLHIYKSKID